MRRRILVVKIHTARPAGQYVIATAAGQGVGASVTLKTSAKPEPVEFSIFIRVSVPGAAGILGCGDGQV